MKFNLTKNDIPKLCIVGISLVFVILKLFMFNNVIDIIAASLLLINNLYCLFMSRKNWLLLVIFGFIAYCNYSVCFSSYIYVIENSLFTQDAGTMVSSRALTILLFFNVLILLLLPFHKNKNEKIDFFINNKYNPVICWGTIIILLVILVFGYERGSEIGQRGYESTIYEYSIILFLLSYYFSGKSNFLKITISTILFLFVFQNFIYGGRVTALQLLLMFFLVFFSDKINKKNIWPLIIVGVIGLFMMVFIGNFRGGSGILKESIFDTFKYMFSRAITLDTAYSAYYTSITFVKTSDIVDIYEKLYLLGQLLLSFIIGGSVAENSSLPKYTSQFFTHCNGGFLSHYGYFYGGYIGVAFVSIYLTALIYHIILKDNSDKCFFKILGIYISCTVLRWYLYSPSNLFRGILLLSAVYGVYWIADKLLIELHNKLKKKKQVVHK